ncbi:DUF4139 domain-containing protein [Sphingorhabdus sp. Alg239-R122]|uniref:DUF4139 domain-containing protein n=1 Tax=Sphingorhabdus sp. Alg239-R122 TaxID=2305989 RepID=UPI001F076856|nr:DUF4139 domain-containing protein [Sphingorhabdus sp. Alg239-R122]
MRAHSISLSIVAFGVAGGLAGPVTAQVPANDPDSTAQGDVSVTIYNGNLALVQDVRQVNVPASVTRIPFPDVSAQIRPETVTLGGTGFDIMEQNFDFDLLSPASLMQKAVGQQVTLLRTNPATGAQTRERAKILAVNGGVVMQIGNRIEVLRDDGLPVRVIFDRIPPNLRAKPTLSVTVDSRRAGTRPLTLSYLSRGLGWNADYVALFDEQKGSIDVQGWITLRNNTGTTFHNAKTLLVAGEVAQAQQNRYNNRRRNQPRGNSPGTESGSAEALADFYIYPLAKRTTIANAQQKQVSFLDVANAAAAKAYQYTNRWMGSSDQAQSADTVLKFSTSREGGLGDALPAGTVRVYMRDQRGQAQFIGENRISHTPGGSDLALKTGEAFDVKVQPIMVSRDKISPGEWETTARYRISSSDGGSETVTVERQKNFWRTVMHYKVTNAKSQPVTVDVAQMGLKRYYSWNDTRIPSESIPGKQRTADTRVWQVPVPANGETILKVTYDTRW